MKGAYHPLPRSSSSISWRGTLPGSAVFPDAPHSGYDKWHVSEFISSNRRTFHFALIHIQTFLDILCVLCACVWGGLYTAQCSHPLTLISALQPLHALAITFTHFFIILAYRKTVSSHACCLATGYMCRNPSDLFYGTDI